jgi:uncharacterized membrane protein
MVRIRRNTRLRPVRVHVSGHHKELLRTNLWLVPAIEVLAAIGLFAATNAADRAAYHGSFAVPSWVISGSADAARQILTTVAAAIITVVGVVFSILIVALTLVSTQFGPRMLRTFIRDRGTQLTLGTFVATFVYAVLTLVSIDEQMDDGAARPGDPPVSSLLASMPGPGGMVHVADSGYLQYIHRRTLLRIAANAEAVIYLRFRPGHFMIRGSPLATVWPASAAGQVADELTRAHVTGPYRTLAQDVSFGIDQLVEIAIRSLSSAVNDTFTAMTCIDWLSDSLCKVAGRWRPARVHRDRAGTVRVITTEPAYDRLVSRSFEKIRQSSRGLPAVLIRLLDGLTRIMERTTAEDQRQVLLDQAAMIIQASEESVLDEPDRADVRRRYQALLAVHAQLTASPLATPGS